MSTDEKQVCLYCKWWKSESMPPEMAGNEYTPGHCHLSAPVVTQWGSLSEGLFKETAWPRARGGDFCGQFQNRRDDHQPGGFDNWKTVGEALPDFQARKPEGDAL